MWTAWRWAARERGAATFSFPARELEGGKKVAAFQERRSKINLILFLSCGVWIMHGTSTLKRQYRNSYKQSELKIMALRATSIIKCDRKR